MDQNLQSLCDEVIEKIKEKRPLRRKGLSVINGEVNTRKTTTNDYKKDGNTDGELKRMTMRDIKLWDEFLVRKLEERGVIVADMKEVNRLLTNPNCERQEPGISQKRKDTDCIVSLFNARKFKIFEDVCESKVINDENSNPSSSPESCSSTPECIDLSPNVLKEPLFSYSKKKKENIRSDLIWTTPYRHDIYTYLKEIEENFRPNPNYMFKQTDISMKMRSILVDWIIEVGEEYKMQSETLHLAVSYVDRFLSHMSVLRGKLQLVGTASMFLASKYEEIYPPELKDFVFITDNTFTKKQVLRMEHLILKVLNFDISVPTTLAFQQLYCCMCNASESVIYLSQYLCELSMVYGDPFLKFRPSIIAAGSLALANYTLGKNMWDEKIAENTGYHFSDLANVIICLYNVYSDMEKSAYHAAYEKYKKSKFGCIANVHYPTKLVFPDKSFLISKQ